MYKELTKKENSVMNLFNFKQVQEQRDKAMRFTVVEEKLREKLQRA